MLGLVRLGSHVFPQLPKNFSTEDMTPVHVEQVEHQELSEHKKRRLATPFSWMPW